ncbi:Uncharacterised protein [Streptococcus pneumoniae]|nr:Uncharacterised protein [Streptococcus pneumoniae]
MQVFTTVLRLGRNEGIWRLGRREILHQIRFIIKRQVRNIFHVQVFHDGENRFFMLLVVRIASIDNMNQKVHMLAFFQG